MSGDGSRVKQLAAQLAETRGTAIALDKNCANLSDQINRLADFISTQVPGEPSQNQGAADTAIRVIRQLTEQRESARAIAVSLENELAEQAHQRATDLWITAADYAEGWHD